MQTNNIFEKLKDLDLKTYLEDSGYEIRNNKMVCPFHEEKTPSLSIKGNFFKCFGCGAAGDAVKFEELLNKVTPLEAARIVCNKTGISWSDEDPSQARA
ncbi:MAG: CHC2 zinc finger domain-containing protein [Helicobacteraceae bacterium]